MRPLNAASAFRHEHVADIDSTNAELLRRAQHQAVHGAALSADFQNAGRGQRGRTWRAGRGDSVLLSVGWAFPKAQRLDGLSLAVGVAVSEAIDAVTGGSARPLLKWPNDLLLATAAGDAGRQSLAKLGGILIETTALNAVQRVAVIGVGINIVAPPAAPTHFHNAPPEAARELASAALLPQCADGRALMRQRLVDALLQSLWTSLQVFTAQGFAPFRERWWQRRAYADLPVQVLTPDGATLTGLITELTEQGALVIDDSRGRHTLVSGTVSLRPLNL